MINAEDIKVGTGLQTWFGTHSVIALKPYNGPFDFILCIARFSNGSEMSLIRGDEYETTSLN